MIDFELFQKEYAAETGITLFNEDGDVKDFYRKVNEINKPVCGRWHINPIPLTAVKRPFCGIATVDITVLSHPDTWEDTQKAMNDFATVFNGTSKEVDDHGTIYSVSYNCQTCNVVGRILDANIGHGEVFELHQEISYIVIESGVSAYDTFLYIDGIQVPFLSLVESKVHTTTMAPNEYGAVMTTSDQEAYGIDFIVPYMRDDSGDFLFTDLLSRSTGNEAHCVVIERGGKKVCRIMQFTQAISNVQPPQNVGLNLSMTEVNSIVAKFNGMWTRYTTNKNIARVFVSDMLQKDFARRCTIFWGDGSFDDYTSEQRQPSVWHIYTDNRPTHTIHVFVAPLSYFVPVKEGVSYYGKWLYFVIPDGNKVEVAEYREAEKEKRDFICNMEAEGTPSGYIGLLLFDTSDRIGLVHHDTVTYIDQKGDDGKYYILRGTKFQCFIVDGIKYVDPAGVICSSLFDEDIIESDGGYIG